MKYFSQEQTDYLTAEEIQQLRELKRDDNLIINREDEDLFY